MGVFNGSISYSKFYVRGEVPKKHQAPYMKAIRTRTFVPLDPDQEEEEHSGWCAPGNSLDLDLSQQKVMFDSYITLALRVDKWRIPRALFRAHFEQAATELKARHGREKLSKREKDEIKFRVTKRLRKKVLPSMRHFDLCWDLDRGVVLFWNRSPRLADDLMALFEQTFDLRLEQASPFVEAKQLLSEVALSAVDELDQSSFASK
ncbi:MAG: hypothetical protein RJA70_4323 [Pseudomonadota bacterium]